MKSLVLDLWLHKNWTFQGRVLTMTGHSCIALGDGGGDVWVIIETLSTYLPRNNRTTKIVQGVPKGKVGIRQTSWPMLTCRIWTQTQL